VPGIAQDRASGQDEAKERRDHEPCFAHRGLEVRAEGEEQRDDPDGRSEHPEQVSASLLRHDRASIACARLAGMTDPSPSVIWAMLTSPSHP
jgi:hypothetical protein